MAEEKDFSIISVDDSDAQVETVIRAGAASVKDATETAADDAQVAEVIEEATEDAATIQSPQGTPELDTSVKADEITEAIETTESAETASENVASDGAKALSEEQQLFMDASPEDQKAYLQHLAKKQMREANKIQTDEDDLQTKGPFLNMQRIILVLALLFIIAAVIYVMVAKA